MESRCASSLIALLLVTLSMVGAQAWAGHPPRMDEIVVTAVREARQRHDLAESVGVIDGEAMDHIMPGHPSEALNRLAGVHVNNLGGEGHMTSIRQPLTTGGVYLFLEDGIPTRPTGFFNHNGLYEIDLTQSGRVEVTRGPGSALYGSDAIGGMINSITPAPGEEREAQLTLEAGEHDRYRALFSTSGAAGANGRAGVQVNVTDSRSFRDAADYRRYSVTARWDQDWTPTLSSKTVLAASAIDQSGTSPLTEADYLRNPEKNLYHGDVGSREVRALRLSTELAWEPVAEELWTLTLFVRDNRMDLVPFWMLSYDPNVYTTEFSTLGLLAKYRRSLPEAGLEWIAGVDVDYSPSSYRETRILLQQQGDIFTGYRESDRVNYDYDADQFTLSPYVHLEWLATEALRFTAGVRYDRFDIDYSDNLDASVPEVGVFEPLPFPARHHRPDDQRVTFDQWSPKLGLVYDVHDDLNLYATYRHAFRAPTAGHLFRGGAVADTTSLEPVTAVSREIGVRGRYSSWLDYEIALYHMSVDNDIVSLIANGTRKTVNAGETRHRGVEVSLLARWSETWSSTLSFSHSRHDYRDFRYVCVAVTCNFAGNDMPRAPRNQGNITLAYAEPSERWRVELEGSYLGSYYTDEVNSRRYGGHSLFHLRGEYRLAPALQLYARLLNITDRRYAAYVSNQVGADALEFRPGEPRTATLGVKWAF